jgi:crotonobetainyl-CoA:carnitine CoA-transferase CaiB-like acyl-CoA transferase
MEITGDPDGPPVRLGDEQSHFAASQYAATAILAALYHRDAACGEGQHIDVSIQEAMLTYYSEALPAQCWLVTGESPTRVGITSTLGVPLGLYPCADGWVSLAVATAQEWDVLAAWINEVTGDEEVLSSRLSGPVQSRAPYVDEVNARVMNFTTSLNVSHIVEEGQSRGLGITPLNTVGDLLADSHLQSEEFWMEIDHPIVGKLKYARGPFQKGAISPPGRPSPLLGEHNREVYCGELGLSSEELTALRSAGVV